MDDERQLYLDAIRGLPLPSLDRCIDLEKYGALEFCGNQWNPDWRWRMEWFKYKPLDDLKDFYKRKGNQQ